MIHTDTDPQPNTSTFNDEDIFADLQSLWDEQTRRIDHLCATHPEARPVRLNLKHRHPRRRRAMVEYLILALVNVAAGIYALTTLLPAPYLLIRIMGIVLVSINTILAIHSLYCYLLIHHYHPARVSVAHMSRFIGHIHAEPHYVPKVRKQPQATSPISVSTGKHLISKKRGLYETSSTKGNFHSPLSIFNYPQFAAVSVAVLIVLTVTSCSPIGDGHAMSKSDRASRAIVAQNIDTIINQI